MVEKPLVLIVDAEETSIKYITYILKQADFKPLAATSGKQALIDAWRELPDIIILESDLPDISGEEVAQKLRNDRRTKDKYFIAFTAEKPSAEFVSMMDVSIAKGEGGDVRLLEAINNYQKQQTTQFDAASTIPDDMYPETNGHLIVFLGAKGGTGTSSLCANIASSFADNHSDLRHAVIDLVLPVGSIAHIVGYEEEFDIVSISQMSFSEMTPAFINEQIPKLGLWNFHLVSGSPDPESGKELDVDSIHAFINLVLRYYDFVFVDLGRTLSKISIPLIVKADQVIVTLNNDISTINLTKIVFDYLWDSGLKPTHVFPLINRTVELGKTTLEEIQETLDIEIQGGIPFVGANLSLANYLHQPVSYKFPDSLLSIALNQIAEKIEKRTKEVIRLGL